MLVYITHNKIMPRSSQVLYSQDSLASIKYFIVDKKN